jgi:hypothetical protein
MAITAKRPYSQKPRELESRGRLPKGVRTVTGSSPENPLLTIQIPASLKILTSTWQELEEAARERKWSKATLVREILVEWVARRRAARDRARTRSRNGNAA